jgi:hypothetical protein
VTNPTTGSSAWRVPIDGGTPTKLSENIDRARIAISPDGTMVAVHLWGKTATSPSVLAAVPAQGGDPMYRFDAPAGMFGLAWSPDSKNFQYILTRDGVSNLWETAAAWWTRPPNHPFQSKPDSGFRLVPRPQTTRAVAWKSQQQCRADLELPVSGRNLVRFAVHPSHC